MNVCLFLDDRGNQRLALDGALLFHIVYRKMITNHEAAKSIPNLWGLVLIPESRKIRAMRFRFRPTRGGTALVFQMEKLEYIVKAIRTAGGVDRN